MSEQVIAPVEAPDPFQGGEPTFEEFSKYRESGEVPERFKAKTEGEAAPATENKVETVDGQEPPKEAEQDKQDSERDENGKFRARPKTPFTPEQQDILNREIKRAKETGRRQAEQALREEYGRKFPSNTSEPQATAADKKPTYSVQDFFSANPPQEPTIPDLETFPGTIEDFKKAQKESLAARDNWRDTKRDAEQAKIEIEKAKADRLKSLEAGYRKITTKYPDYQAQVDALGADIKEGTVPMGQELIDFITFHTDSPLELIYHLCKHRDDLERILVANPQNAARDLFRLEGKLAAAPAPARKEPEAKPKPPEPVGARATSSAFDVNDEKLDPDEWARQRNEQVSKRRR